MAGLGRRTFAPGEVLTATNVMGYLQDQAVMNFAGTAARGSAIGTAVISEGMVTYLADTNDVQVYDGSAWRSLGPSNKIVQIVSGATSTQASSSSTTYADTGLTATITPTSASSKIIVLVSQSGMYKSTALSSNSLYIKLLRNSTDLFLFAAAVGFGETDNFYLGTASTNVVDSPNTTSAVTYKTQFRNETNDAVVRVQADGGSTSEIILIEVSA